MNSIIILGSSRQDGHTAQLTSCVAARITADVIYLGDFNILPYDYTYHNQEDDFNLLIERILTYDEIIFASPIYWYSPCAQMKVFLDRLSDLLSLHKNRGRLLRGKRSLLLATGADNNPPDCFEQIFALTFKYLGMRYHGMLYCTCENDFSVKNHQEKVNFFIKNRYAREIMCN